MSAAVFRTMLLGLVRDRQALAMSFVLPAVFFVIFASIFAGATGGQMRLRVAFADEVRSETSARLVAAIASDAAIVRVGAEGLESSAVRELVRRGTADAGLIVRAGGESLDEPGGFGAPPLVILTDPVRGVAAPMLAGQIQKAYFAALPDVALRNVMSRIEEELVTLTDAQQAAVDSGLASLRQEAKAAAVEGRSAGWALDELYEREDVAGASAARNHVAYAAGAVAVLFLLFSCVHGALSVIDERDTGLLDRILAGPAGSGVLIDGRLAFLTLQGFVQVGVIFAIAWAVYGVSLLAHFGPWVITTLLTSAAAAALALALTAACATRRQAQTFANVAILILSALGGSMVPRFFMPGWLQDLGWITPTTWALEAYTTILWRGGSYRDCLGPWAALALATIAAWFAARVFARRREVV